jgi:hypothetical protein
MSNKLDDYKGPDTTVINDPDPNIEPDVPEELTPDPNVVVATGDEEMPVGTDNHGEAMKNLYDKGRRNREKLISRQGEGTPDVALVEAMVNEASSGDPNAKARASALLNTNREHRFEEDIPEAQRAAREEARRGEPEGEEESTNNDSGIEAPDSLTPADNGGMVTVVILGKEYEVPQQDVDDAGGVRLYQKERATTIRLQRAATLEKRALLRQQEMDSTEQADQLEDPSPDGHDATDIETLRNEVLDAVADGTTDDLDALLEKRIKARKPKPAPKPKASDAPPTSEAQAELDAQYEEDRIAANTMMIEEYPDLMRQSDLLSLTQQRFKAIASDPRNVGRSQKAMAREAANHVRNIIGRGNSRPNDVEAERQQRIERKRQLPQPSRAAASAPDTSRGKEKRTPSRSEHFQRLRRRAGQVPPS